MKRTLSALSLLLVVLAVAVAVAPAPAAAQDFSRFVVIGDSLTHGYMSSCVVKYGQNDSWGAVVARAAGVDFQQPVMDDPGVGGCMYLTSLTPSFDFKPSVAKPLNALLPRPYNNLGVSGFTVADVVDKKGDTPPGLTDTVLRGQGTVLQQATVLAPTFVSVFIGNNDELGAIIYGLAVDGVTLTTRAAFKAKYDTILKTLVAAQGGIPRGTVATLPDSWSIPLMTTLPVYNTKTLGGPVIHKSGPYAGTPWRYTGSRDGQELPFGSLINLLGAAPLLPKGFGVACGMLDDFGYPAAGPLRAVCDKPAYGLPEGKWDATKFVFTPGVVAYPETVAKVQARLAEFNTDIKALAVTYGYKVFDVNAVFTDILGHGRDYGGMAIKTAYLSGGFFSYDGVHLTSVGYAILADEYIQFINRTFVNPLPRPNLMSILLNGNTSGGWFPLPQGINLSLEEQLAFAADYAEKGGLEGLQKVFAPTIPTDFSELQPGDDSAPVTGSHGLGSHGRGSTETAH